MDKLIPLPPHMDGTRFLEVTYTVGDAEPVATYDWPLIGWDNTRDRLPVVVELDGHLATKQTASYAQQIAGGSHTFFITRIVQNPLDVGPVRRDLVASMRAAFTAETQHDGQVAIDDVELPA